MKKILIVSYALPPYGGIGGRRWAKFGRLLLERGYDVKFLSQRVGSSTEPKWTADYEAIREHVRYFDSAYPSALSGQVKSTMEKVNYRLALSKIKGRNTGNYFDKSGMDEQVLIKEIKPFLEKGYNTVISTGAPFNQLYFLAKHRAANPTFKLVADLRDPWTKQDWSYGFQTIDIARKKIEEERESFVMKTADLILSVAGQMVRDLEEYDPNKGKFHTLYNGFDEAELTQIAPSPSKKLSFVYTGNLYDGALGQVKSLIQGLDLVKDQSPGIYHSLSFDFYGNVPNEFHEMVSKHPAIQHKGTVALSEAHRVIRNADVALLFLIDKLNYSMSTKFFEYLAMNRSILLFAIPGDTSQFITENKIGWHYDEEHFVQLMQRLLDFKSSGSSFDLPDSFDKEKFNIKNLCSQLESLL